MKSHLIALLLCLLAPLHAAERPAVYPFDVKIGGQLATAAGGETTIFAKIARPVAADSVVEIPGCKDMVIINVTPVKPDGTVPDTSAADMKVILIQQGGKAKLSDTMDKSKLSPGLYGANIVANSKTSRVMFEVE